MLLIATNIKGVSRKWKSKVYFVVWYVYACWAGVIVNRNKGQKVVNKIAVEDKHSSPEKAIKFYCDSINEKNVPACKTIIPPDFLKNMLSENLPYVIPTNLLEKIEVKQFIKFEDISDVNIWSVFPDSQQLKICYVDVYLEYIDKDMYGEGKVITGMPTFICSYQQGKWYAMMNE